MSRKYEPLAGHLDAQPTDEITMRFAEVAAVVGSLPPSAVKHQAWWANSPSHVQAKDGWLAVGWKVASFDQGREVATYRRERNITPSEE